VSEEEINERWLATTTEERDKFMRYGRRAAPDEAPPDFAARILKFDPKITLLNARRLVVIFRSAYNEMVAL